MWWEMLCLMHVSIHAPRGGRDSRRACSHGPRARFNPRAPWGARRPDIVGDGGHELFQSTRPVGGATRQRQRTCCEQTVSIHAPRGGRDMATPMIGSSLSKFQSTRPVGGATPAHLIRGSFAEFQSTRPVGGATPPAGMSPPSAKFQSTRPVGGATGILQARLCHAGVSIHAPRGGRDIGIELLAKFYSCFNPRAPWGARHLKLLIALEFKVSIHAPRGGRDPGGFKALFGDDVSIHAPRGGRDSFSHFLSRAVCVSIHAPRGGRDSRLAESAYGGSSFNPRAPWGARRRQCR